MKTVVDVFMSRLFIKYEKNGDKILITDKELDYFKIIKYIEHHLKIHKKEIKNLNASYIKAFEYYLKFNFKSIKEDIDKYKQEDWSNVGYLILRNSKMFSENSVLENEQLKNIDFRKIDSDILLNANFYFEKWNNIRYLKNNLKRELLVYSKFFNIDY